MVKIEQPAIIEAAGNRPKIIEEFVGRVNSGTGEASIARMTSPVPALTHDVCGKGPTTGDCPYNIAGAGSKPALCCHDEVY